MSSISSPRPSTLPIRLLAIITLLTGFLVGDAPHAMIVQAGQSAPQIRYSTTLSSANSKILAASTALSFTTSASEMNEADGQATLILRRTGESTGSVTARVDITGGTADVSDYLFTPGALDHTFQEDMAGANGAVAAVAVQDDGKLLISGGFTALSGTAKSYVARLNSDGSLDNTFSVGTISNAYSSLLGVNTLLVQPDGKILIGGNFSAINETPRGGIARLNSDGSLDANFPSTIAPNATVYSLAFQPDGEIIVGGSFHIGGIYPSSIGYGMARLHPDGNLDSTFKCAVGSPVLSVLPQSDGKILVSGDLAAGGIARVNADCSRDTSFEVGADTGIVYQMAIQDDGKILIGGHVEHSGIARLNIDGSLDSSFDLHFNNPGVEAVIVQPDGKILVGGYFSTVNGIARDRIARLNSDGSLDTSFDPGIGNGIPFRFAMQRDGKILVGGNFTTIGGIPRRYIARLHGDLFATWDDGETADQQVTLPIVDDALAETDETLIFSLTPTRGGASAGQPSTHTLTIIDSDNTPPTIAPIDAISTSEDQATGPMTLTIGDAHTSPEQLTVTASSSNQTLVPNSQIILGGSGASRSLLITPAADQFGIATITITVSDGSRSTSASFILTVTPVNDPPSFTGGPNVTVGRDAGAQLVAGWAHAISAGAANEAQQALSFEITANDNPSLFRAGPAVDPTTGDLTFTPAAQATGVAHLILVLRDNGETHAGGSDTSTNYQFTINITETTPTFIVTLPRIIGAGSS